MFAVIKQYPIVTMRCLFVVDHGSIVQSRVDEGERRKSDKEGSLHHGLRIQKEESVPRLRHASL